MTRSQRWYDTHPGYHYKSNKKWRRSHTASRSASTRRYYRKHSKGAIRGYRYWELWEIDLLMKHSIRDVLLARKLKRTMKAICVKRAKVKREGAVLCV